MLFGEFLMIRIGWMNLVLVSKITILFWKIVYWIIHNACSIYWRLFRESWLLLARMERIEEKAFTTPHLYGKFIVSDIDAGAGLKGGTRLVKIKSENVTAELIGDWELYRLSSYVTVKQKWLYMSCEICVCVCVWVDNFPLPKSICGCELSYIIERQQCKWNCLSWPMPRGLEVATSCLGRHGQQWRQRTKLKGFT